MNQVLLCIDYGTKRVGLALAFGPLAEPLRVIVVEHAIEEISRIIREHSVTQLVVGVSEGKMAEKTHQFIKILTSKFRIPIHLQNETLSSAEVHEEFRKMKAKKSKKRQNIDHYAAAKILQDYLDENKPFSLL